MIFATLRYAIYTKPVPDISGDTIAIKQPSAHWMARWKPTNPARLMDAFVDKLDLAKLGFAKIVHKSEGCKPRPESQGRPPYEPGTLLKLYL
jgi:hypothetical protein